MPKAKGPTFALKYRRRRENKTDFARRLALVKSSLPRLVVRKTNSGVIVQLLEFTPLGDKVIASAHSSSLSGFGWYGKCNSPSAYLTGLLCAKKASKASGKKEFCADLGLQTASKGSVLFAAIKGAMDGGLKSGLGEGMVRDDAIDGSKISAYAGIMKKESKERYEKAFSEYIKRKISPEELPKLFADAKQKILAQ